MRISAYSIPVKIDEERYLLINSCSGAIDLVDKEVIDLLESDLSQGDSSIFEFLTERGHVTELSPEEELNHVENFCRRLHAQFSRIKTYIIIPTYRCNLRCTYCFEKSLYSKGEEWVKKALSFEEVDLLFEAFGRLSEGTIRKKPLTYFGGEPMLPENIELLNYIMREGSRRGYIHYFVTNGTNIQCYLPLLRRYPIHGLQITLDGTQEVHNSRRKGPKNEGTFQCIVEGIELLREHRIKTYVRVTVDRTNIDSLGDLAGFMKKRGWHTDQFVVPYLVPVFPHGCREHSRANKKEISVSALISLWNKNELWEVFKRGVADFHPLESALRGDTWTPQFYKCRAHTGQLFFDPHGKIYTCWEAVGEAEHSVGHFIPGLEFNKTYEVWRQRTVFAIEKCRRCKYAFMCGGGCAYRAYKKKGTLFAPVCEYTEKMLKEYIPFYYCTFHSED